MGLSLILIISFVINLSLTDSALHDLLRIISLHCPSPNFCVTSLYILKKYFAATKFNFKRHYYCPSCKTSIDHLRLECPNVACGKRLSNADQSYFSSFKICWDSQFFTINFSIVFRAPKGIEMASRMCAIDNYNSFDETRPISNKTSQMQLNTDGVNCFTHQSMVCGQSIWRLTSCQREYVASRRIKYWLLYGLVKYTLP